MRKNYTQVRCDYCNITVLYTSGYVTESAREQGWVVSKYGDFHSKNCFNKYKIWLKSKELKK